MRIQQVSDYGTAEPIVARLVLQTQKLLPFYDLTENQRQQIFGLMFSDIQPILMSCSKLSKELTFEIAAQQRKVDEVGLDFQAGGRAYTIPSILDLQSRTNTFLYHAKCVLRDCTKLFFILFEKDFESQARFDRVVLWAEEKFGHDDELTTMLKTDEGSWIRSVVGMRNAVEHPGGYSGTLHVENFTAVEEGNKISIIEPRWYLNDEAKSPIAFDMPVIVDNLLTLCEEALVRCLEKFKKEMPIFLVEIPESDRNPQCPIRFEMRI